MHDVVFEDENYQVLAHLAADASAPYVVSFSAYNNRHDPIEPRHFKLGFGVQALLSLGLNCISFSTNRNDWYQGRTADAAIAAINAWIPAGRRRITYGSSMGGFAAINFAEQLKADYFVAISPQATMRPGFFVHNNDSRWQKERRVLELNHEHIVSGVAASRQGVILYDDQLATDAAHAVRCAAKTSAQLFPIPFSGHPSGKAANACYGLKRMVREIAFAQFDPAAALAEIRERNETSLGFLASNVANASEVAARLLANPKALNQHLVVLLIESLRENDGQVDPLVLAWYASILRDCSDLFAANMAKYKKLQEIVKAAIAENVPA